jgi:hypothetical protein
VHSIDVLVSLDRDSSHAISGALLDGLDHVPGLRVCADEITERQVVREERDTADLEQVLADLLGPELLEGVAVLDVVDCGAHHDGWNRSMDEVRMRRSPGHRAAAYAVAGGC